MKLTATVFTLLSAVSTLVTGLPAAVAPRATDPISQKTRPYYELCADLQKQLGIPTVVVKPLLPGNKRDEIYNITFDDRSLDKREVLSPALPLGRSYNVVNQSNGQSSRGHRAATAAYTPIGKGTGPCLVIDFAGSYNYALVVTGNPFRLLNSFAEFNYDFNKATQFCQAACDNFVRFQSVLSGGPTSCNAISPWVEIVTAGDPLAVFSPAFICDLYPKPLIPSNVGPIDGRQYTNGLLANAINTKAPTTLPTLTATLGL